MFSDGQRLFALFFILAFALGLIFAYRKDIRKNPSYFKGVYRIFIAIVTVVALYIIVHKIRH